MKSRLLRTVHIACMVMSLLSLGRAHAQEQAVTGRVIAAEDGTPLIGVQVVVQGTQQGTTTDTQGYYSITPQQSDAVLVFNYVGYVPLAEKVGARTRIDVTMKMDNQRLEDVIVMGYTSVKKAELTSSVVSISGDELQDVTTSDIGSMLQGKAAGVLVTSASGQPGAEAEIRIRGTGSITASSAPLYVVDGIPGGSFDPNDVQTLTVLKDIGATAIYGADGAGGVIVVTTKQARRNEEVKVDASMSLGVKQSLFGRFKVMDSHELYQMQKSTYAPELFEQERPASLLDKDFDWMDKIFGTGFVQKYYASASGGSKRSGYFASVSHYNEDGSLINTGYMRTNVRLNLNAQLAPNFQMVIRGNYMESRSQSTSSWATLETGYRALPWDYPYDVNTGEPLLIDSSVRPDNGEPWYSLNKWNILHNELYNYSKTRRRSLDADLQLSWQILPWLNLSTTNRFVRRYRIATTYIDPRTTSSSYADGNLSRNTNFDNSFRTSNLLKAAHAWGDHSINAVAGYEYSKEENDFINASGQEMPAGMDVLSATSSTTQSVDGYPTPGATWSVLAQVQYTYKNRYFFTGSFRADASSRFAADNRVGYFPSVTGGWLVSEEKFLKDNPTLTFLKLRASWGKTGNSNIGYFRYMDTFSFTGDYYGEVGALPVRMSSPRLGWESATMLSVGADFTLAERVEFNVDFYRNLNEDLLLDVPVSPSTGFFNNTRNVGSVRNQGIEIAIKSVNIRRKNFTWTTSFNFGLNRNKVLSLPNGTPVMLSSNSVNQRIAEGRDMFTWYMPEWLGVDPDNGDPLWWGELKDEQGNVTGEGPTNVYADAISKEMGSATPKFTGGLLNTFRYRNWSLSVNANFLYGNKVFNYSRISMDADGAYLDYNSMSHDNNLGWSRWEKPGDVATHPKLVQNGNKSSNSISSRFLENGSYLRIRNVTLSYELPTRIAAKAGLSGVRVYLSGDNLLTVSKYSGSDPEVSLTSSGSAPAGISSMPYPVARLFSLGLEIKF